jgi:hypothetical protein
MIVAGQDASPDFRNQNKIMYMIDEGFFGKFLFPYWFRILL